MVPEISGRVMPAEILQQAQQALEEYLRYTGEGRFQEAADSLAALRAILQKLTLESSPQKQSGKPAGM